MLNVGAYTSKIKLEALKIKSAKNRTEKFKIQRRNALSNRKYKW